MSCIHQQNDNFKAFMKENLKKSEEKVDVGEYQILFGKYKKIKTFNEIFNEDKPYVAYLIETLDYNRNRFFLDYWMDRICDGEDLKPATKKITKPRKKKERKEGEGELP